MKAMVLAAGVGSRLDPLTSNLPKPLVPVANVPVMEHIVRLLSKHGFTDIVANLHYLPDMLVNHFGDGSRFGVNLTFRLEEELSGDAGGVRACRDFFGKEPFMVMMGDLLTDADLSKIYHEHRTKKALATIAVKRVKEVEHFGIVVQNEQGFITGFQEKPERSEAKSNMASAGIYVLQPEVFKHMPETGTYGFGRQLFPMLVEKGLPVLGSEIETYWSDVGTISQYKESNFDVLKGIIDIPLAGMKEKIGDSMRILGDGSGIDSSAKVSGVAILGRGSRVMAGASLKGAVVVGDNCTIQPGAHLENVVIWSGVTVKENAVIKDSIVGNGCVIEAGTELAEVTAMADACVPL
ncbi:MAG: sugar phosphate nucleotidyltransferase [Candidatus Obscuribacterales bacterium]